MKVRLIFFAALLAFAGVACSSKKDTPTVTTPTAGNAVTANGNEWSPKSLAAPAGEVTFSWGSGGHNVVADDGTFTSGGVTPSGSFKHTFAPGTYAYYCAAHGGKGGVGMAGTVTVA